MSLTKKKSCVKGDSRGEGGVGGVGGLGVVGRGVVSGPSWVYEVFIIDETMHCIYIFLVIESN